VPYFADVDRAISKHPFDPNRAHQLLGEAGLIRGGDGVYVTPTGQRFSPELRATATILADMWRQIGVDVRERYLSEAEDSDREIRSTFPAFASANTGLEEPTLLVKVYGGNAATAANRWGGTNRGGYISPEFDRFYDVLISSLRLEERNDAVVNAMRVVNLEVPIFPLYFNDLYGAFASALIPPPNTEPSEQVGVAKIHEWRWR
jgi:ABC-type transport system substrate-binding protein